MEEDFSVKKLIFEFHNWEKDEYDEAKEEIQNFVKKNYNNVLFREKIDRTFFIE